MTQHYDVIIIGAGAGGGTLAYALAPTGKRILIIERGDYLPREKENWDPDEIFLQKRYQAPEQWLDNEHQPFDPQAYYLVGGNTKLYGAALQRMRAEDFGELHHADGISPSWPFPYEDFETYYTRAESLFKIHGQQGEDPTEPMMSADYPHSAMPHEPRIQAIADQLGEKGLHPVHLTLALDRNVADPRQGRCIRCDTCDPYPCMVDAKCDAQTVCVDPALEYDNVTLFTNTQVTRLLTSSDGGRVEKVEIRTDEGLGTLSADTVVVSCGAINSAVLLLKSANEQHPNGLANSSDQVGRNLMKHNHSALIAIAPEQNPTVFQKTLGIHDYYFKGPSQDYPLGQVQLTGKAKWQRLAKMTQGDLPEECLRHLARHSVDWWITTEDLPSPDNRVTLTSDGRIKINFIPNNSKPHDELVSLFEQHLRELGFYLFIHKKMDLAVFWHQVGTCRFGDDPKTSVLNVNCRTHDLENVYVVDASFLPSMGAMNPTLTIIANALRVADHLKSTL
ncbi:GMC family oxidoreductase [Oscillatoria sp. CS-180]|uniref:GMC oxidoreductase n=1 Tax=Oscillatoria sp. CS-180 TaxID=3021720 RepID=UPI00232D4364|nr:GMC family oxidoreductase [Oscillatoria sp. CS-180]MDB9524739.1 GMC family oxidoreductase [Oscillatoria sp. CS-180]